VPGMVTELRITPSKVGQYKLRCAELCGTGHYSMLADVVVMEPGDFDAWVSAQAAKAASASSAAEGSASTESESVNLVESGAQIAQSQGCLGCHSTDGSPLVGPTWLGVYGSEEELQDGTTVLADEAYIKRSIVEPGAQITQGYDNLMPATYEGTLSSEEINALVAYIESLAQ
jgi:cytochrome c oxidase subunit 2